MASQPPAELYFSPACYYSQMVQVGLAEQKLSFSQRLVNLDQNEHCLPWFLRINPKGRLPVLRLGEEYITNARHIMEEVDWLHIPGGQLLFLDPPFLPGKRVRSWTSTLYSLDIEYITDGLLLHPSLSTTGLKVPKDSLVTKEEYKSKLVSSIETLEETKASDPHDLTSCVEDLIERKRDRLDGMRFHPDVVKEKLRKLDNVFDQVEEQLNICREDEGPGNWLCDLSFTAADVTMCTLLGRLDLLGLLERYADPKRHPFIMEYWAQATQRPSVRDHGIPVVTYMNESCCKGR